MGSVFAMQGLGQFAAGIISLIVTAGFKESLQSAKTVGVCEGACAIAVDKMWREYHLRLFLKIDTDQK